MSSENISDKNDKPNVPDSISFGKLKDALNKAPIEGTDKSADDLKQEFIALCRKFDANDYGVYDSFEIPGVALKYHASIVITRLKEFYNQLIDTNDGIEELEFIYQQMRLCSIARGFIKALDMAEEDFLITESCEQLDSEFEPLYGITDSSIDIMRSFGPDTPTLLNEYACSLEDALIEQVGKVCQLNEIIRQLKGDQSFGEDEDAEQGKIIKAVMEKRYREEKLKSDAT